MHRRAFGLLAFVAVAVLPPGCGSCIWPPVGMFDPTLRPPDASGPDAFFSEDTFAPADAHGAFALDAAGYCGRNAAVAQTCITGECFEPWTCRAETNARLPSWTESGGAGRPYPLIAWADGRCEGSCDVDEPDQCDRCTVCFARHGGADGECLKPCLTSCTGGYACDVVNRVCVPACAIVEGVDTCQFTADPGNDPWTTGARITDHGMSWPWYCDTRTGRCVRPGSAIATAGDDCTEDTDCENDGACVISAASDPPSTLSDGYCVRHGCDDRDLPCRPSDVCTEGFFGIRGRTCMNGCVVGAETTDAERIGPAGGHPGCGPGEACFWDRVHGTADGLDGACFPGNYNDVSAYNVGAECSSDDECWSPYGLGRCLMLDTAYSRREDRGICAVMGCGDTGSDVGLRVDDDVVSVLAADELCRTDAAGGGDFCAAVSPGNAETACIPSCDGDATQCPTGWACRLFYLESTGLDPAIFVTCTPDCSADRECVPGARCLSEAGESCPSPGEVCFCTVTDDDAGPASDDAGLGASDGGIDDAGLDGGADLDAP